ncbi:transcriptional regulator, AraC family [Paraburkholderia atlantica]|uniref:Transcriptional regulator, AraC family n=1 Tax=Paraburkholderia atlantica TaxID=2654982 RepID=D5W8A1_PARAM|nr:helix-turn-helix domain-containing protein [Paraburkholderia atlantica]ADG15646.1 transcriptional regulator, AraC family [Paraburkholderia atlantica]
MQLENHTFTDAGEHAAMLPGWEQQYFQLDCGPFQGRLQQIGVDGTHLFYESVNRRVVQQGSTPSDMLVFGIVLDANSPVTFADRSVPADSMICARASREFFLHFPGETALLAVGVKLPFLAGHPELAARLESRLSNKTCVIPLAPGARAQFIAMWRYVTDEALALNACAPSELAQRRVSAQILDMLDALVDDGVPDEKTDITWMSQSDVVARAHDMILARPMEPVTVQELCESLRISRRTVQTSFRLVTGKSPVEYMRAIRLNHVRQLLRKSSSGELTVRAAAQRWGFFHSGHFTQDYRELFEAMPSDNRPR